MNTFGEFLCELRKEKHMTQSELASAIGVTNKAVSKWELGESMPETSLLLPLSRIFDITVDELLAGKRNVKEESNFSNKEESKTSNDDKVKSNELDEIKGHIFTRGKDDKKKETLADLISGILCSIIFMLGTAIYLIIGLTMGLWTPYWVIFPCCGFLCGIVGILFGVCDKEKRAEKFGRGENPYTGAACGLIMLICLIIYLPLGAILNLWHPCWAILVVGGFLCAVVGTFGKIGVYKNSMRNDQKKE